MCLDINDQRVIPNNWVVYPKIYKQSSTGKVLVWWLERDENKYHTVSGQLKGKKTISSWKTAKPKNVGKKNETIGEEQADKECLAKYDKKLKGGGYVANIEEVASSTYTKPMLAETYYNEKWDPETGKVQIKDNRPSNKEYKEGIYLQPKLDGVRCIASKDGLFTRKGEKIIGVPHIAEGLTKFFEEFDIILDGELYNHSVEFNCLSGTIRRDPKEDDNSESTIRKSIEYFVYDIVSNDSYKNRLSMLNNLMSAYPDKVYNLSASLVTSEEKVDSEHDRFVEAGYEGVILRKAKAPYKCGKRSKDLLKVKQFEDDEFTILDVIEGDGNNSGMAAKLEIEDNGVKVYPNMTGRWEFCQQVLAEKEEYIGGEVTVKFFGRTPDGSLRHPSVKAIYKKQRDM